MSRPSPLHIALTLDLDPDANRAVPGRVEACSGAGDAPSYDACLRGLDSVLAGLAAHGLPATLFWAGQTARECLARRPALTARLRTDPAFEHACHGHAHEDFAGADSALPLDAEATLAAVRQGTRAVTETMGSRPRSFRAPYCRLTPHVRAALPALGYRCDASLTRDMDQLAPRPLDGAPGVWELPLARARDAEGRVISTYLWQMFELHRPASDYVDMLAGARDCDTVGLVQIALHPWHLHVDAEGAAQPEQAAARWHEFLDKVTQLDDLCFTTVDAYCGSMVADR